jgi:hypothetical protein
MHYYAFAICALCFAFTQSIRTLVLMAQPTGMQSSISPYRRSAKLRSCYVAAVCQVIYHLAIYPTCKHV